MKCSLRTSASVLLGFVLTVTLAGCGMSNLTSGLGSSIFGSKPDETTSVASVSEEQLLNAAKLETGTGVGSALVAHGCPKFDVWPANRFYTTYEPGREGDGLAIIHRGEITKTARECQIEPGLITVKYGFSGRVLLGPKGQSGTVNLPLSVHVTNVSREKISTETVNLAVTVPQGKPIGYFSTVRTVTFQVPEGERPADYKLFVAFDRKPAGAS